VDFPFEENQDRFTELAHSVAAIQSYLAGMQQPAPPPSLP
jgi:hypothetical protein